MSRRFRGVLIAAMAAAALTGCGGGDDDSGGEATATATPTATSGGETAAVDGEALFKQRCASCHTLAAAGASGQVGPNLDELKPDVARVKNAIETAPGVMPENLASGEEEQAIAEYVAGAAGGS